LRRINDIAKEAAAKLFPQQEALPQRLKAAFKQRTYRSAEALRHPKARAKTSFSTI
jgi:hypothetical protein